MATLVPHRICAALVLALISTASPLVNAAFAQGGTTPRIAGPNVRPQVDGDGIPGNAPQVFRPVTPTHNPAISAQAADGPNNFGTPTQPGFNPTTRPLPTTPGLANDGPNPLGTPTTPGFNPLARPLPTTPGLGNDGPNPIGTTPQFPIATRPLPPRIPGQLGDGPNPVGTPTTPQFPVATRPLPPGPMPGLVGDGPNPFPATPQLPTVARPLPPGPIPGTQPTLANQTPARPVQPQRVFTIPPPPGGVDTAAQTPQLPGRPVQPQRIFTIPPPPGGVDTAAQTPQLPARPVQPQRIFTIPPPPGGVDTAAQTPQLPARPVQPPRIFQIPGPPGGDVAGQNPPPLPQRPLVRPLPVVPGADGQPGFQQVDLGPNGQQQANRILPGTPTTRTLPPPGTQPAVVAGRENHPSTVPGQVTPDRIVVTPGFVPRAIGGAPLPVDAVTGQPLQLPNNPNRPVPGLIRNNANANLNQLGDAIDRAGNALQNQPFAPRPLPRVLPDTPANNPFDVSDNRTVIDQTKIPTIGRVACGPTACGMIMSDSGQAKDITAMAHEAGITPNGTEMMNLAMTMQRNGMKNARPVANANLGTIADATSKGHAALVRVVNPDGSGHFVVVDGVANVNGQPYVAVRDPWGGARYSQPASTFVQSLDPHMAIFTNPPAPTVRALPLPAVPRAAPPPPMPRP